MKCRDKRSREAVLLYQLHEEFIDGLSLDGKPRFVCLSCFDFTFNDSERYVEPFDNIHENMVEYNILENIIKSVRTL